MSSADGFCFPQEIVRKVSGMLMWLNIIEVGTNRTIVTCSQFNVKLPAWAREAIVKAHLSIPESWDDVFGRPVEVAKGKSVAAERRRRRIGVAVIRWVKELNSKGTKRMP